MRQRRKLNAEINVTPFVDVMLVLLVIFMVTSPMLTAGIDVELPKTKASAITAEAEPITISITKQGEIYLEKNKIKLEEIQKKLEAIGKANKNIRVFVRADKAIEYGRVMEVFGQLKSAGYKNIALISETL